MRIASWNINSVRLRIDSVARFVKETAPDVLCLQETKVTDAAYPKAAFDEMGFSHHAVFGQKGYHGVAVHARTPILASHPKRWCGKQDSRHLWVELDGGIELHNFYVPAGGDEPDPARNDKFAHKLEFLDGMAAWFRGHDRQRRAVLVGDLNVAPLETDVWSHKQLRRVVTHTPAEVSRLEEIMAAGQWIDAVRAFVPAEEKLFSWWSYRAKDWAAANKGRRLDHIWLTPALRPALTGASIVKDVRGWERPSDHAPVIADLAL